MSTVYPNAEPVLHEDVVVGEAYLDSGGTYGYLVYAQDFGADGCDSLDEAIECCQEDYENFIGYELRKLTRDLWEMKKRGMFDEVESIIEEIRQKDS